MIKAVIFDMDGLMFDTESLYYETEKIMATKRGKIFSKELMHKMMGRKSLESIKIMKEELGLKESLGSLNKERESLYEKLLLKKAFPMKGLNDLLEIVLNLKKFLALATASKRRFVEILLNKFHLTHFFKAIITEENVLKGKPDPEIYSAVISKLDLHPNNCLVLEDSRNGLLAAKNAGCFCIVVPNQFTMSQDFSEADMIVSGLDDKRIIEFIRRKS
ncbi:MAG: HAD family phosphatase [Deltaproteobacteria bacterium]|nr:HAD family phosphatase [Deltaproteobacteria bacterium]